MAYRIYLVDDDHFLLDLYAVKFKNAGHEVSLFNSGDELLGILRKGDADPDAILTDVIMPGMTGIEMIGIIRKEELAPKAKIIVLSNQDQEADLERAREVGVDGYIVKASAIPSEVFSKAISIIEGNAVATI